MRSILGSMLCLSLICVTGNTGYNSIPRNAQHWMLHALKVNPRSFLTALSNYAVCLLKDSKWAGQLLAQGIWKPITVSVYLGNSGFQLTGFVNLRLLSAIRSPYQARMIKARLAHWLGFCHCVSLCLDLGIVAAYEWCIVLSYIIAFDQYIASFKL